MKKCLVILTFLLIIFLRHGNADCTNTEVCIYNNTSHTIYAQLYPVSMVFNGLLMYNLVAQGRPTDDFGNLYDYINGVAWAVIYPSTDYSLNFRWKM
jgi:hypothetical protein